MLEQADGKLILYGSETSGSADGVIVRVDQSGVLDLTFGESGIYTTQDVPASDAYIEDVKLDSNQKLVAVGRIRQGGDHQSMVVRINPDGSQDTDTDPYDGATSSFTAGGYVLGATTDLFTTLVIDANDDIYAAGTRLSGTTDQVVVKYTNSGTIDTSFNGTGELVVDMAVGTNDEVESVLIDSAGKLIVLGNTLQTSPTEVSVFVVENSGTFHSGFSSDGKAIFNLSPSSQSSVITAATIDSADNIVLVGYSEESGVKEGLISRILPSGALDTLFNSSGYYHSTHCDNDEKYNNILLLNDTTALVVGTCSDQDESENTIFSKFEFWEEGIVQ